MIKIDVDTRYWKIPKEEAFLGVESDDKVKILQFELSKNEFCDGLNFTDCNCFINYKNEGNDTIPYLITDMEVQEDGTVTFTWEVSRGATIFKGNTFAILCAKKVSEDGTITNEWNSRIGSFTVSKGLEPSSSITEVPEIDIISQLLSVAQQTNANAQTNIDKSSSLLEKAEGLGYLKEEYDVLEARMNQFTSLKEGATTGDAELIDGRIGYDGKVHDNIGGAIREQVSELKGDIDNIAVLKKGNNLFNPNDTNITDNAQIKLGGDIGTHPTWQSRVTDFIEVDTSKSAILRTNSEGNLTIGEYDADKTFICKNAFNVNTSTINLNKETKYIRIVFHGTGVDLMVYVSDETLKYEAYEEFWEIQAKTVCDKTLSEENIPADSKSVGDKFTKITDSFDEKITELTNKTDSFDEKINSKSNEYCIIGDLTNANPLYEKTVFCFGDSHSAITMPLWRLFSENSGSDVYIINGNSNGYYVLGHYEKGVRKDDIVLDIKMNCDTYNWSQYVFIAKKYCDENNLSLDYIITENCHYSDWSNLINDNPIIFTGDTIEYPTVFETANDASSYFSNNLSSILEELNITHDNASLYLKYVLSTSQRLDFTFMDGAHTLSADTIATIQFGSDTNHVMATSLTSGMSLTECIDAINQWEFSENSDWKNENKSTVGNTNINLSYVGGVNNDKSAMASISFSTECNLSMESVSTSAVRNWDTTFKGASDDDLTDKSLWLRSGGNNGWSYPNYMLGAMEYLKLNSPSTKVVFMGIENYSSSNSIAEFDESGKCTNSGAYFSDGTINARAVLHSSNAVYGRKSALSSKLIAKKYGHQYIDMALYDGMTPYNIYEDGYYNYSNVHMTEKGYKQWAKCLCNRIE